MARKRFLLLGGRSLKITARRAAFSGGASTRTRGGITETLWLFGEECGWGRRRLQRLSDLL